MSEKLKSFIQKYPNIYFVGIKGVGMTALAVLLKHAGAYVSGSDTQDIYHTDVILKKNNIPIYTGFSVKNIPTTTNLVIVTGAHGGMTNIEAAEGKRRKIQTIMHGQALGLVMDCFNLRISVCGCHGKTTTSAMVAHIFSKAGKDPSYVIGSAELIRSGSSGCLGQSEYFIAEADEYMTCPNTDRTPRFLWQNPLITVITNIEYDHPDAYQDIQEVRSAFAKFAGKIPNNGLLVLGIDNIEVQRLMKEIPENLPIVTYGFSPQANFRIKTTGVSNGKNNFQVYNNNVSVLETALPIPGNHNILNATAAFIVGNFFGLSAKDMSGSLQNFYGTKRRFERIGSVSSIELYDDYAHHPTELAATLKAIDQWFVNRNVFIIFQPHTYSRTKSLQKEFIKALSGSSHTILVTDIFASARESIDPSVSAVTLVKNAQLLSPHVHYTPNKEDVWNFLKTRIHPNDVIFTMGAGDIYKWHDYFMQIIKNDALLAKDRGL